MAKSSSAAKGFLGSLILLVAALVVFFVVLGPGKGSDSKPAVGSATPADARAVETKRQSLRGPPAHHPAEAAPAASQDAGGAAAPAKATDLAAQPQPAAPAAEPGEDPDVQKAINLIDNGNIADATALLEGVLKRDPKNEQALVELAMVSLLDLKQPGIATGYLQRVMDVNPTNQIVLSELVSLYEEQGKLEEGLSFLMDVNTRSPGLPELSYGIGQLLSLQGRDAEAVTYLEKATQSPDSQVRAFRDLGEAYSRSGEPEKAIDAYSKAIASQEKELADKQSKGQPVQFIEERLAYTKMDKVRELIRVGDTEQAQQLLDEVRSVMPAEESVTAAQASINRKKAG